MERAHDTARTTIEARPKTRSRGAGAGAGAGPDRNWTGPNGKLMRRPLVAVRVFALQKDEFAIVLQYPLANTTNPHNRLG